jgi:hypothetical protein
MFAVELYANLWTPPAQNDLQVPAAWNARIYLACCETVRADYGSAAQRFFGLSPATAPPTTSEAQEVKLQGAAMTPIGTPRIARALA